jgi:hypothetical protein
VTDKKFCFLNERRPCDLTCKAAFEVDDPVDNIDCHFVWLAYHFGEAVFELKRVLEGFGQMPGHGSESGSSAGPGGGIPGLGGGGPRKPKGYPNN